MYSHKLLSFHITPKSFCFYAQNKMFLLLGEFYVSDSATQIPEFATHVSESEI